ncbi:hypothetical protein [Actinomadura keratinilytica]|uniref:SIS domain-containing protein n=1 Tax=Actinomadura keratinilytica TaxID=547461 RepID=A0ABP7ZEQ4_9ACTN
MSGAVSRTEAETAGRPDSWRRAIELARRADGPARAWLLRPGERVAVAGCGTSWFMAQSYAALREGAGAAEPAPPPAVVAARLGDEAGCAGAGPSAWASAGARRRPACGAVRAEPKGGRP